MELYESLSTFVDKKALIAITGGGGKTTLMENLGQYFKTKGFSVLITTTTKVASPVFHNYKVDYIYSDSSIFSHEVKKGESVFYSNKSYDSKKWISPPIKELEVLTGLYDVVIYEADGSRGLPLKYHTERDPVILPQSDIVIGVMGLWGIGHKAYEMCFGDGSDEIIDKTYIERYLYSEEGLSKGMDRAKYRIFLFNGAESVDSRQMEIINSISISKKYIGYIVSEKENKIYGTL